MLTEGCENDHICPCIWKYYKNEFFIIVVYVDDINIVGTFNELTKAIDYLKKFEMKDLGKAKICLKLEIEYLNKCVFVHQESFLYSESA